MAQGPAPPAPVRRLRDAVARALGAAGLTRGDRVIVACSHGPDSLALADAVVALRRRLGLGGVTLVYVDHGLRPAAAAREAAAVRAFAEAAGAEARVVSVTVDRGRGGGLEEAARAARYAALDALHREVGARLVLLGHTASDQAETVLCRLLRGAGVTGLAGIPVRRGPYLRPLLELPRAAILDYVAARALAPSHDGSNEDPAFLRNRVRHRLLPALRAENPSVDAALVRAAAAAREVADALDWAADVALERVGLERGPDRAGTAEGAVRLEAAALASLPPAVCKRLLARLAAELGSSLGAAHLEALAAATRRAPAGTRPISVSAITARREYGLLVLERRPATAPPALPVSVRGEGGPFAVRTWRPGDRMRPAGLGGHSRKLQDLFVDRKVPARLRRRALVVVRERDGELVWAQHIGAAAGARLEVELPADPAPPACPEADVVTPGLLDEAAPTSYQVLDTRPTRLGGRTKAGRTARTT